MNDEPHTIVRTVHADGSMTEIWLDAEQAARRERGESWGSYETVQFSNADAIARVAARNEQIETRLGEMVSDHPDLKSLPVRPDQPDDDAA